MDKFSSLLTKENVTFLVAVLGFMLSLYNFFSELLQNRMNLRVTYKNHHISVHDNEGITISLSIENRVKIPLSISRAFLNINEESLEFYWIPQFVFRATQSTKGTIHDEINIHTTTLPAHIEGYGVIGGFFYVKSPKTITNEELLASKTSITIYSNKGVKTYPITMNNTSLEL